MNELYPIGDVARLELVRTLRELDAGLDEIRRVLAGEATLRALATTHLALLARQEARLRSRRAVLWTEVTTGWEPPERMVQWWRAARPELPEHPTAAQLEAWIELAEMVRDTEVRQAVRRELYEVRTTGAGPLMTSSPMLDTLEAATPIGQAAMDAARERVPPA
jgi:DNA-binding transcriptional MerR regulator